MTDAAAAAAPPRIKICGFTSAANAAAIAALGVDYLGLNFWPSSRRYLEPQRAAAVAEAARAAGPARLVGVFVNASVAEVEVVQRALRLDVVQLHGDEEPATVVELRQRLGVPVWKAVAADAASVEGLARWDVADAILLDAPSAGRGGSGLAVAADVVRRAHEVVPRQTLILAGGLRPDNVAAALQRLAPWTPWALDAASGVELAPGHKDPAKVSAFLRAARTAARDAVLPEGHA